MNTIVGRYEEKKELEDAYKSQTAELIAVYGRRRIGKTYLIKNIFSRKTAFFFETIGINKGPMRTQLSRFARELGNTFYSGTLIQIPKTWIEAFEALTNAINQQGKNKKIVIFIDELPWLATPRSGLIEALEYFWNRYWSNDKRIKLIICGSSASWIIKKIIKNKGGLHNRVTRKLRLLPFNLSETNAFLKLLGFNLTFLQTTKLYMITGGIPFYLKSLKKNLSIDQNINQLFFNPNGLFFDEFNEVFSSLFDFSEQYKEIVTLIAQHPAGMSRSNLDKENKLTGKGGRLTQRLEDLENTGFITSYIPFQHKRNGLFYRISDEYCFFYLKWIDAIKDKLKLEPTANHWKNHLQLQGYAAWQGYAFENICYKHLSKIKKALKIEEFALASPWRYCSKEGEKISGAQVDLVFDRNDDSLTLCEIKFSEKPYIIDKEYAKKLLNKSEVFKTITKTNKQLFIAMITSLGLKENIYNEDIIHGVVTLSDLF